MDVKFTDKEIQDLIDEPKILPDNYRDRLRPKPKRGHKEADLDINGVSPLKKGYLTAEYAEIAEIIK